MPEHSGFYIVLFDKTVRLRILPEPCVGEGDSQLHPPSNHTVWMSKFKDKNLMYVGGNQSLEAQDLQEMSLHGKKLATKKGECSWDRKETTMKRDNESWK